jgi:glycosyltransferase involved in cell wall biosynthesis
MFGDGAHGAWVRRLWKSVDFTDAPADRPDVLWAIHGSDSAHALARQLARRFDIPWVADYKDNWDLGKTGVPRAAAYVAHQRRTSSAIAITAASRIGARHLGEVFDRDVTAIYTGVDVAAWRDGAPADLGEGFNIVFTGHATSPAMGVDVVRQGLVQALKALPADVVNVHYFGHEGGWLRDRLRAAGFGQRFIDHGFEPQYAIIRAQKGADLLLYLPYIRTPLICVKFFEYLASGRPILSVPAERDAREDIDGLHVARNADDVAATLVDLVSQWRHAGRLPSFDRDLSDYEWRPQSEILLSVLTGAARATSCPSELASL